MAPLRCRRLLAPGLSLGLLRWLCAVGSLTGFLAGLLARLGWLAVRLRLLTGS